MPMKMDSVYEGVFGSVLSAKDDPDLMRKWLDPTFPASVNDKTIRDGLWAKITAALTSPAMASLRLYVDREVPNRPPEAKKPSKKRK